MPFALVGIGLILIVTGVRDTYAQLGAQITKDFTGQQNFTVWVFAIGSVGALGYVQEFRSFSHYFLALIIVSMVLSNRGFFQRFSEQFTAGPQIQSGGAPATATPAVPGAPSGSAANPNSLGFGYTANPSLFWERLKNPLCWLGQC